MIGADVTNAPAYFVRVPDSNVHHIRRTGHNTTETDWLALLDFCDHVFRGKPLTHPTPPPSFPNAHKAFSWKTPARK